MAQIPNSVAIFAGFPGRLIEVAAAIYIRYETLLGGSSHLVSGL
jgi:hypothetical protein